MRQLELMLGENAFRDGLREYLKRYAYGNATWSDLVRILDGRTRRDLVEWSRAWVEERGRPTFTTQTRVNARGQLDGLDLMLADPFNRGLVWPERLHVVLGFSGLVRRMSVDVTGERTAVRGARGLSRPLYVLPSGDGVGYGLFLLDDASRDYLLAHIEDVPDALTRGTAWVTMWDNLIERRIDASQFLTAAMRALPREHDEQNAQRVLSYIDAGVLAISDARSSVASRDRRSRQALRAGIERGRSQSEKAAWFNAYRDTVLSPDGLAWLERVWRREEAVPGLTLAEPDEIAMALELAVREVPRWEEILRVQAVRTQNPDRKARFEFVMPALSADPGVRERAFARLSFVENRRREPWVLESLQYLNHPLREGHARRFVLPALGLAARDSADRRHLLSHPLDGVDAERSLLAGSREHGARLPGRGARVSAAASVDDPDGGRRSASPARSLEEGGSEDPPYILPTAYCLLLGPIRDACHLRDRHWCNRRANLCLRVTLHGRLR